MGKRINKDHAQDLSDMLNICFAVLKEKGEIHTIGVVSYTTGELRVYGRKIKSDKARDIFAVKLSPKADDNPIGRATVINVFTLGKKVSGLNSLLNKKDLVSVNSDDFSFVQATCNEEGVIKFDETKPD